MPRKRIAPRKAERPITYPELRRVSEACRGRYRGHLNVLDCRGGRLGVDPLKGSFGFPTGVHCLQDNGTFAP